MRGGQRLAAQGHGAGVGGQALGFGHGFHGRGQGLQALRGEALVGNFLLKRFQRHAAVLPGVATGGQRVVGAGGVVAHRLGREVAQEHRARIGDARGQSLGRIHGQNQVLGSILVGEGQHGGRIGQQHGAAFGQGQRGHFAARQHGQLSRNFGFHLGQDVLVIGEQHHLRVGAVLSL